MNFLALLRVSSNAHRIGQVADAYVKLRCWKDVVDWEANVLQQKTESLDANLQKALYFDMDVNRIRRVRLKFEIERCLREHEIIMI